MPREKWKERLLGCVVWGRGWLGEGDQPPERHPSCAHSQRLAWRR